MAEETPLGGDGKPEKPVPPDVLPPGTLEKMTYRSLPEPVAFRKMVGPSIILAGLALGSGEFILWPYITYKSGFVFFWACMLGVTIQYFLNMEIARWSLATGESATTSFIRLAKFWAVVFLALNIIPWMIPAWSKGAAQLFSWMIWAPTWGEKDGVSVVTNESYVTEFAILGMFVCGAILTAGPVIYETVEKIQIFLVSLVMILVVLLAAVLVRWDAVVAMTTSVVTFGAPEFIPDVTIPGIDVVVLLGALAFAGAGGTTNLGQSNYVKDKGYGMGQHIGRITSPITGQEEAVSEVGYFFEPTEENERRWNRWWWNASLEHFVSFFLTCVICLVLLSLISYSVFYDANGEPVEGSDKYASGTNFVLGEADEVERTLGGLARNVFLIMGIAILLTTEFGVLDVVSRISADLVKVSFLRDNSYWTESRLYYFFLWTTILLGTCILLLQKFGVSVEAFQLFKLSSSLNGGVMFLYSGLLLYVNRFRLPPHVRMPVWRAVVMAGSVAFFGVFAFWTAISKLAG